MYFNTIEICQFCSYTHARTHARTHTDTHTLANMHARMHTERLRGQVHTYACAYDFLRCEYNVHYACTCVNIVHLCSYACTHTVYTLIHVSTVIIAQLTPYTFLDFKHKKSTKPLTVQHLMPYINDLADEVVLISGWLGMDGQLEVIRRTFGMITPREQLQQLLKKWLEDTERPNAPHTWEYFVRVVQGVTRGRVADRIVKDVFSGE